MHLDDDLEMYGDVPEYRRILLNQPRVLVPRLPAAIIDRVLLDSYVDCALLPSTSNMNNSELLSSKKKSAIIDEYDDRNHKSVWEFCKNLLFKHKFYRININRKMSQNSVQQGEGCLIPTMTATMMTQRRL
jgi:hypothetical protein